MSRKDTIKLSWETVYSLNMALNTVLDKAVLTEDQRVLLEAARREIVDKLNRKQTPTYGE